MRYVHFVALAALGGALACTQPTGPAQALHGNWRTAPIPSGSGIDLSLQSSGSKVGGTGHQYVMQNLAHTFTITGSLAGDGTVHLTLTAEDDAVYTFDGRLVGAVTLQGEWGPIGCALPEGCQQAVTFTRA